MLTLAVSASFVSLELSDDFFVVRVSGQFLRRSVGDLHHARQQEFTGLERHSRRDIDRLDLAVSRTSRATVGGV